MPPMTLATEAIKRGIASGSPALRVGFSSPIDKDRKRASWAAIRIIETGTESFRLRSTRAKRGTKPKF